ncbi:MAG: autotransporter adhesin family protein, partial [Lachnospiraceae bacterium]|nr:autotransporter adhesin family protein [Lachnospiraceae bacterium]
TTLTISSTISGNTSTSGAGGGVYFGAAVTTLTMDGATIDGNTAGGAGGGAYFALRVTTATITNSSISGNNAAGNGGGVWFTAGTSLTLKNESKVNNNTITADGGLYGGGIYLYGPTSTSNATSSTRSTFIATDSEISGNKIVSTDSTKSYGAGIYVQHYSDTVTMTNTTISGNSGATYGGGAYIGAYSQNNIVLTDLTVSGNVATASIDANTGMGGGLYIDTATSTAYTVTISGGTYSGNTAEYQGGAVYIRPYLIIKDGAEFCDNGAYSNGGAIFAYSQMEIDGGDNESTAILIHGNSTENGNGGGVYGNSGTEYAITVSGWVKVYENKAQSTSGNGGGLATTSGGMYLEGDIWVYDNYSYGSYGGGGLYQASATAGTIYLGKGVKVYNNTSATNGGGVTSRYHFQMEDGAEIYENTATSSGGGVNAMYVTMDGGEVHDNSATSGGGFYDYNGDSPDSYYNGGAIYANKATNGSGGGIHTYTYTNIIRIGGDIEIYDNSATNNGGGVFSTHHLYVTGGSIHDNTAAKGGGVFISGYRGQVIEITGGIIYDNIATSVNSGNDIALNTRNSSYVTNSTVEYSALSMSAASTFTDTANNITGTYWYDEGNREEKYDDVSVNNESSAYYYTFVYTAGDTVAKVYNTVKSEYEEFVTVQAAVDAIENASAEYGTEGSSGNEITIIMIDDSREDVTIPDGVEVTLDLAGHELKGMALSVIMVESGATLTIEDSSTEGTGTITGGSGTHDAVWQASSSNTYMCGGGLYVEGTAILNSGTISGNKATYGAGVYVGASGTFTMNGGSIESNSGSYGGVYVRKTTNYSATTILNATTSFTMTGGIITGNSSGNGAGIYFVKTAAVISGGSITGNTATSNGGGIYVTGVSYIQITDAEITGNTAVQGGGIYSDTNTTTITVSNDISTVKLYGNTATSNKGNDIYANVGGGSLTLLDAADMGNDAYTSWLDSNADGSDTYPYYYENGFSYGRYTTRVFYLTATSYSGGYVAYIPDASSTNKVYKIDNGDGTYSYTMEDPGTYYAYAAGTAYSTLQGAINAAATSGDVIYLLSDVEESLTVTAKSVTIDFNGYTVSSMGEYGFYLSYTNNCNISTELVLSDTETDVFHNTDTDAEGTLTVASSNSSDFPRAIYSPSTNNATYPTKITVDGILVTGFGNYEYANESGTSSYYGGAIYAYHYNEVTIKSGTKLTENYAYFGGAIYVSGNNSKLTIEDNVTVTDNEAYYGGGIYVGAPSTSGSGSSIVYYTFEFTVGKATISENSAYKGGGIYVSGYNNSENLPTRNMPKVVMTGTIISDNTATNEDGGACFQYVTNLTMTDCEISGNYSGGNYGGVLVSPGGYAMHNVDITISGCSFTKNIAASSYGGLGVNYGTATITDCTFTGNQAATNTSAFYSATVQYLKMTNCTFTENINTTSGYVMYLYNGLTATLTNVKIDNNTTATTNGAVFVYNTTSVTENGSGANGDYNITFDRCTISGNNGYGIEQNMQNATYGVFVTLKNTTISGNGSYGVYLRTNATYFAYRDKSVLNIEDGTSISGNGSSGVYAYYATVNMNGGEICYNTSTSYGGGVYAYCANFNMSDGSIYGNEGTYGGGIFLREMTTSYEGGDYYESVTPDTISGGKIYGNISTATNISNSSSTNPNHAFGGGGVYVGDYNELVMTGGTITDNTAVLYGGGVCMSDIAATFTMTDGQIYDNTANLGQDVYAYYTSAYANTSLYLMVASDMFESGSDMTGVGWLNESTNAVTTTEIDYSTVKKIYPLTLEYDTNTTVAVIWNVTNNEYDTFTSVQDAVDALQSNSSYYYTEDITSPEIILVDDAVGNVEISGGQTLTINLNGYTLKGYTTAITCYGTLNIIDVQYTTGDDSESTSSTYCIHYSDLISANQAAHDSDTTLGAGAGDGYTGTITGYAAENGGGVAVYSGGSVTMASGQIANCTAGGSNTGNAYGGAGVYVENGTFVLGGTASINNCSTKAYGAAVFITGVSGSFTLQDDAVIENNSSNYGAVYLINGTFKMTGGSITSNTATNGGGAMYIRSGTAKITAGTISDNTATNYGGGIYLYGGTLTLSGSASITGNSTTAAISTDASKVLTGAGGGIYMYSGT